MSRAATVVIPVFNGGRFLRRTIESLLAQTYEDFTIVVRDDVSTDDSMEIALSFRDERLRVVRNAQRRGLSGNWNAALALTSTPLLVIAHQDDLYAPGHLATAAQLLETHPRAFIAHTRATYIDENDRPVHNAASQYKDRFWPADEPCERSPVRELGLLQQGNYIICPSVMYRMSAVAEIGRFDERYHFVPDWDYWFRGLSKGFTIVGTHERLLRWRRHEQSATKHEEMTLRRYDEELALLEKISLTAGLPPRMELVENTLLSDFADRLARGDRAGAAALLRYSRDRLSGARRNQMIMKLGLAAGPIAGKALKIAEAIYTRFARPTA